VNGSSVDRIVRLQKVTTFPGGRMPLMVKMTKNQQGMLTICEQSDTLLCVTEKHLGEYWLKSADFTLFR